MANLNELIKQWALTNYGLVIADYKIEHRIAHLMTSLDLNEKNYIHALKANNASVVNATIDMLTVQESYFFRDSSWFAYLKNSLLPELIKAKKKNGDNNITIWSAGCSYGEEIYSIAICLNELLIDKASWKLNLIGTDIDEAALNRAREGSFTQTNMRATDSVVINKYFDLYLKTYTLKKYIRDLVKFSYCNLADLNKWHLRCDVIICRNVFIYLNQATIEYALEHFYENLVEDGILFLGPSDLITYYQHRFTIKRVNDIYLLKKTTLQRSPADEPPKKMLACNPPSFSTQLQTRSDLLQSIRLSLNNNDYHVVLEKIDHYLMVYPETALLYRYKAEALICLGDLDTAVIYLTKSVKLDPLDATIYFMQGLIEVDMKHPQAAIAFYQKALYLKRNFPEAAYHLGLLYLKDNQHEQGIKLLKQALNDATGQPKDKPVLCANGTMEALTAAIKTNITYYQGLRHE